MKHVRLLAAIAVAIAVILAAWYLHGTRNASPTAKSGPQRRSGNSGSPDSALETKKTADSAADLPINLYAHHVLFQRGPNFRVYMLWLRGQLRRTQPDVTASFDHPASFSLDIDAGVLHANIADINHFLKVSKMPGSPLKDVSISGDGNQIKLTGTLHKGVPLPIEMTGTIAPANGNDIRVHISKISVLKIPVKGLLGDLHLTAASLMHPEVSSGIQVSGNDLLLDPQKLFPAPHIRGRLKTVRIVNPDLEEIYGDAEKEATEVAQWHNFLRLRGGTLDFGKLTMHNVDLVMIDLTNDAWFDLDLSRYQEQAVNGYTLITPQDGLQIFMLDWDKIPSKKTGQNVGLEWLKNRNLPPPEQLVSK